MWRIIKIVLGVYLIANLIGAYFFWHRIDQFLRFMPRVAEASFTTPTGPLEAQRQDLSHLKTVLNYDRSFSPEARHAFDSKIESLKSQENVLSKAEFYMRLRELMSLADNGHTNIEQSPAFRDFNRSGIDAYPFADGMFIVRAQKDHVSLIGQKILSVEGRPIAEVMKRLEVYSGGPKQWRDLQSINFLRSPQLLNVAGLAASPLSLSVTLENTAGEMSEVSLNALKPAADTEYYFRHSFLTLAPNPLTDEEGDWVQTLNQETGDIAPYLRNIFDVHLTDDLDGGLYIRSNYLMSSSENPVKQQLLSAIESAPDGGYDFMVLDLRWNPGGDYENTVPFAKQATEALSEDGKIYIIVGPNTFSAAIVFTALLKQYAPNKALLIGEPMGDRPQFWAERGKPFVLPNSDYWINYAVGFHDWENGCAGIHEHCFPPNKRYDANIGKLALDKFIQPTYADYESGRDVVIEWVLQTQSEAR